MPSTTSIRFWSCLALVTGAAVFSWLPSNPFLKGPLAGGDLREIQGLESVLADLHQNLSAWPKLSREEKYDAIHTVIDAFRKPNHIVIEKPPSFYIEKIDEAAANPQLSQLPIEKVMMILAVMEYDFDTGKDKDALAREVLGPSLYELNLKRREEEASKT